MSGEISVSVGTPLPDEAITLADLVATITSIAAKVNAGSITERELADGSITSDKLSDDVSEQLAIPDNYITTAKLADAGVTAAKIADGAVTNAKLAAGAVDTSQLADGAVDEAAIDDDAVTTDKIQDGAVTNDKISAGYVPTGTILAFAMGTLPAGWLECDGAAYTSIAQPDLFAAISTTWGDGSTQDGVPAAGDFNVPDLRGRFLRGHDNGKGRDPDAASRTANADGGQDKDNVGSVQDEAFKGHTHEPTNISNGEIVVRKTGTSTLLSGSGSDVFTDNETESTGGSETRPKNAYVLFGIKS